MTDFDRKLDGWQRTIQRRLAAAEQLQTALAGLSGTAESDAGTVRVTVDASGTLTDLYIAERALRRSSSAADLSDEIMQCFRQAQRTLAHQVQDVSTAILGEDSETMAMVNRRMAPLFGDEGGTGHE